MRWLVWIFLLAGCGEDTTKPKIPDPGVPVAVDDAALTQQGQSVTIDALANDSHTTLDAIFLSDISSPTQGSAAIEDGMIVFTPSPSFAGVVEFNYTVSDALGASATGAITVTVNGRPIAVDDSAITQPETPVDVDVLANDSDFEQDTLTIQSVSQPTSGTATMSGGLARYVPNVGFTGADEFTYEVVDTQGGSATATVRIVVNSSPIAMDDFVIAAPGEVIIIPVTDNDTDPEGHPLTITRTDTIAGAMITHDGQDVTFVADIGQTGTLVFSYTIEDGFGGEDSADVHVELNSPPNVVDDSATVLVNTLTTIDVLANDIDIDNDAFAIVDVSDAVYGNLTFDDEFVYYSPDVDFEGLDSFTYTVRDARGAESTGLVHVRVVQPNFGLQMDAGATHTCEVRADNTLWCWGQGQLGSGTTSSSAPVQIGSATNWRSISIGGSHSCGTRTDNSLWCWGSNGDSALGVPNVSSSSTPLQVGTENNWQMVNAASSHTCAIKRDKTLWCWGENRDDQLGLGRSASSEIPVPTQVGTDSNWTHVAGADLYTCALRGTGELWCWGENRGDGLGDPALRDADEPVRIGTFNDWDALYSNDNFACALRAGALYCWGRAHGQDTPVPTQLGSATNWSVFDASTGHSCGIRSGQLYCWGANTFGQLGDATTDARLNPTRIGSDSDWLNVVAGRSHTCGQREDGSLYCWGHDRNGQLGDGTLPRQHSPQQVGTDTDWLSVDIGSGVFGYGFSCGIKTDGTRWCFGANQDGQLGNQTTTNLLTPTQSDAVTTWSAIGPGQEHACGIQEDQSLWCWGNNWLGMLGSGSTTSSSTPVSLGGTWVYAEGGRQHSCGLRTDGTIWCWGNNGNNQIGQDPSVINRATAPVQLGTLDTWEHVASGEFVSCGIRGGQIWCWGRNIGFEPVQWGTASDWKFVNVGGNNHCALKLDDTLWCGRFNQTAAQVGAFSDWALVSAFSEDHICAIRSNQDLYCWGQNQWGQVGNNSTQPTGGPVLISAGWQYVSTAGANIWGAHTCGVKTDGTLWCWGDNGFGQTGQSDAWVTSPQPLN